MILRDRIEVRASPASVFWFFERMHAHYLQWHPDHKLFRWTKGSGLKPGTEFYFEEVIAGKLLKKNVVFTRIDPGAHIEFAPTFFLMRAILPRMLFRIEPRAPGALVVTAEIHLRMGPLAVRLNRKMLAAVREHMRVEGINLKRMVEAHEHGHAAGARDAA
ncbi:MAG: hypothetical protein R3357_09550 [Burkholderiales bacterium]|nr:hypothetical protein [Burkholderiales bacterium]